MSTRLALLASGFILCSSAARAEEPIGDLYGISGSLIKASADRTAQCSHSCVVTFMHKNTVVRYEATRIEADSSTGYVRLVGKARVILKGGTEIQAENMTLVTFDDGRQQLDGIELRFIPPKN